MKRKIAIITHWDIPNYGTFLQAYASQRTLSDMFSEDEVKLVAYMGELHKKMYYSFEVHELFRMWLINPFFYIDVCKRIKDHSRIKSMRKFLEFYDKQIIHTNKLSETQLEKEIFDTIVLGSDILWDYSIGFFERDKNMFGVGLNASKIISYAASFGTVKKGMGHPQYVIDGINRLNAIAVRDQNSADIVKEICGREALKVVDPTWLWNFKEDENIVSPNVKCEYIVVYGSFFSDELIREIVTYSKKNDCKIIYMDSGRDKCNWCDIFIKLGDISPFEWCGYIRDAKFLVTCTFHGLMFGLIYEKKIVFNATEFMLDKASDIIDYLELRIPLIEKKSFHEVMNYTWDYKKINEKIKELRELSLDYLKNNI